MTFGNGWVELAGFGGQLQHDGFHGPNGKSIGAKVDGFSHGAFGAMLGTSVNVDGSGGIRVGGGYKDLNLYFEIVVDYDVTISGGGTTDGIALPPSIRSIDVVHNQAGDLVTVASWSDFQETYTTTAELQNNGTVSTETYGIYIDVGSDGDPTNDVWYYTPIDITHNSDYVVFIQTADAFALSTCYQISQHYHFQ